MAQYAGVSFKRHGQIYFFTTSPFVLNMRDRVLVKTEEGIGFGEVMSLRDTLPEGLDAGTLKPIELRGGCGRCGCEGRSSLA